MPKYNEIYSSDDGTSVYIYSLDCVSKDSCGVSTEKLLAIYNEPNGKMTKVNLFTLMKTKYIEVIES